MKRRVPLDADGFERIDAEELLLRHREATVSRGDIVRAVATLTEEVRELRKRVGELEGDQKEEA